MAFSYNIDEVSQPTLPSVQHDIRQAKKFLMRRSPESDDNLYDHLSELLARIISERPKNAIDIFEDYSKQLKNERLKETTGIRDVYVPPLQYEDAQQLVKLFKAAKEEENVDDIDHEVSDGSKKMRPTLSEIFYYLEKIDICIPRSEIFLLTLTIPKLIKEKSIKNVRFWGKILGRPKNYYIIYAELGEEELSRRQELEADKHHEMRQTQVQDDGGVEMSPTQQKDNTNVEANVGGDGVNLDEKKKGLDLVFPPIPRSNWKPPPVVPTERIGMGLNKMIYFVCNSPGLDEWIELTSVTPQQIVAARQIVHCFTGCLKTPMNTFPVFPGNEGDYLRAQIARITASTHVSPIGYLIFEKDIDENEVGEEELEEEEEISGETIVENPHFAIVPMKELVDPSMSNWCHYSEYILEQGRTIGGDGLEKDVNEEESSDEVVEEEGEEEDDEEEVENEKLDDDGHENEKEIGLPLFTPLSEDIIIGTTTPAWTARISSEILPETGIAMIRSNVWPGAIAFAKDEIFGHVYIGWGHKFNANNYYPSMMLLVQSQYKVGPEIMEIQDPSVEAEGGYKKELPPPAKLNESDVEEEETSDEEEEETSDEEEGEEKNDEDNENEDEDD